jgi:hypothetical protein
MSLPIRLVTRQYIDLRTDEEAGLGTLLSAINFYLDEKQTLEMKRPSVIKSLISAPISTPYSTSQTKRTSRTWFLATGIIMVVCILGAGVAWTGYRLYTLSIPITGPEIAEPTIIVIAPTESIAELPTDTPTDIPTDIPAPIILNVPVPGIVSQYLVAVQVTNIDTFDDPNGAGWDVQAGKIEDGMMELYGNDDWNGAWRDREFVAGEGTLIDFSFSKGSTFTIHMNNGVNGNSYRRFGLYFENDFPIVDLYIGDFKWEDFSRITGFQPNRTYTVLIARLSEAEFVGAAWDTFTQSVVAEFRKKFDDIPDGSTWTYLIQVPGGTIQFDNFTEITFSGVK